MIYGIDYLAGAQYPEVVLKAHPRNFAAGFFAQEFGGAFPLVQKLANTNKVPYIRIHLVWDKNHNYGDQHIKQLIREAKRYGSIKANCIIELSGFCEHKLNNPDKYLDIVKEAAPSCVVVNNPLQGFGKLSNKYKNETHSGMSLAGPYNFSYDGQSAFYDDVKKRKELHRSCDVFFLWTWQLNLHANAGDHNRKSKPTGKLIRELAGLV